MAGHDQEPPDDPEPAEEPHRRNEEWIRRMRARPPRTMRTYDISTLMDEVRDELGR